MKQRRTIKRQAITQLLLSLAVLLLCNVVASKLHKRFDLTKEKRYTLSSATKHMLNNLDDDVYVKVYLEGDFPAGFKRLRSATEDMLYEFNIASGGKVKYIFINPSKGSDEEKKSLQQELYKKGLSPTNLQVKGEEGASSQQIIFPGMVMNYRDREVPVQLLDNQVGFGPDEALNNSIELLEYKMASSIRKLTLKESPRVAIISGEGELPKEQIADFAGTLQEYKYDVRVVDINKVVTFVNRFDILVIAKPTEKFREEDKFKLDQFVMNGGSILWLLDPMTIDLDSLRGKNEYISVANDFNLDDQLFRYGVRINPVLVQDLQCTGIPVVVGAGNPPQTDFFPWVYFPIVTSANTHAIVKNLDAVMFQFTSTIDTIRVPNVKKTILLTSSAHSKALPAPVRVAFDMLKEQPNPKLFNQPDQTLAVLLEGNFTSVFKNRLAASMLQVYEDSLNLKFRDSSDYAKMIVVADGDVIKNSVSKDGNPYPLGYYPYTNQTFANKDFMLNCVEYLSDNSNLIETRNKEIKLRLLDKTRIKDEKLQWQLINLLLPLGLLALFGLIYNVVRRRKYTR